jgi:thiamine biosynthesis lipoprotein
MSRFRPSSELSRLCLDPGHPTRVSPRLYRALAAARRAWRVTDGAFDPRVRADLDRLGYAGARVGGDGSKTAAHDRRSRPWLLADPRQLEVSVTEPVDLGGIGKGLALRWAWHALVRATPGIAGALIEAGGDMMLGGLPALGDRWEVRISDPMDHGSPLAAVHMGGGAISTSASTANRWASPDGAVVHHLIDPRTGSPSDDGILQVTVAGPDPAWTEVWCKVLYLAGAREVEAEARRRGLAAWWVERDGTLRMTPLARLATHWTTRD